MTNFLSPLDPIFFLHHSNIDRLWDVWTRKQKRLNLPYLPTGQDLESLSKEPFLFFVDGKGKFVGSGHAGDYLNMESFEYEYEPGFGEKVVQPPNPELMARHRMSAVKGAIKGHVASVALPSDAIKNHLSAAATPSLIAEITLPRPNSMSVAREFDVVVGAPPDVSQVGADSPYYAGTIAFFGSMMNMKGMSTDATFSIPLPKASEAFHNLEAAKNVSVSIRILPSQGHGGKARHFRLRRWGRCKGRCARC
jgi:tyrosinase